MADDPKATNNRLSTFGPVVGCARSTNVSRHSNGSGRRLRCHQRKASRSVRVTMHGIRREPGTPGTRGAMGPPTRSELTAMASGTFPREKMRRSLGCLLRGGLLMTILGVSRGGQAWAGTRCSASCGNIARNWPHGASGTSRFSGLSLGGRNGPIPTWTSLWTLRSLLGFLPLCASRPGSKPYWDEEWTW